jgi:Neutral/alkaline non-lysosomal ceramidase, N-terminal
MFFERMPLLLAISCLVCSNFTRGEDLLVGASAVKITPPLGSAMAGYFHNRGAEAVHDDLYAKALVIEKDGVRAALVVCDLISIPREVTDQVRSIAAKDLEMPGGNVMISATHAHTGPVMASEADAYNLPAEMRKIASEYSQSLPGKIVESLRMAIKNLQSAKISAAAGTENTLAFNRRFFMKDGTVGWNPGKNNPAILRPTGPIDPEVPVVYFESNNGKPLATYVNFTMHLDTVGGLEFSADYPYTLSKLLAAVKGPEMVTIFSIGTAGNINHLDVGDPNPQSGHYEAARIGTVLAAAVLKTYRHLQPVAADRVQCKNEVVRLPLPSVTPGDAQWAREISAKFGKPGAAPFMDQVRADKIMAVSARQGKPIEAEIQVFALGNQVAWVGLPGEVFVELGLAIKRASPYPVTIVTELANDDIGYVPNREAYPQGAYEPVSARVAQGSGEMLVDTAIRILTDLFRETAVRQ